MAEYLRRTDLVHPNKGPQETYYHVKMVEGTTLQQAQDFANLYLTIVEDGAIAVRALLMDTQYFYIPPVMAPPMDERHVIKLTFAAMGSVAFQFPA